MIPRRPGFGVLKHSSGRCHRAYGDTSRTSGRSAAAKPLSITDNVNMNEPTMIAPPTMSKMIGETSLAIDLRLRFIQWVVAECAMTISISLINDNARFRR
jgi:hypothetical protein